jgi:protein ImuA
MPVAPAFSSISPSQDRATALTELRLLLSRQPGCPPTATARLPFGVAALDGHLPHGGLTCGALHEVVPATQAALPAAFGFIVAVLARFNGNFPETATKKKIIVVMPHHGSRQCGRLSGHGLSSLGFNPRRVILVETAQRHDNLWALLEALRSGAPQAVVGLSDRLDLKTSQRLHLAAADAGLPLLLLRPSQTLESSAAATRWRIGPAAAARDRFDSYARPRWRLQLERCRNGRPGEWVVEYDHVAHRFSLVAALADQTLSRGAGDQPRRQACRS